MTMDSETVPQPEEQNSPTSPTQEEYTIQQDSMDDSGTILHLLWEFLLAVFLVEMISPHIYTVIRPCKPEFLLSITIRIASPATRTHPRTQIPPTRVNPEVFATKPDDTIFFIYLLLMFIIV